METQVARTEAQVPQTAGNMLTDMGASAQDIVVPRLLLMQNVSEMVGDDEAKMGDILNAQTNEVIGGLDKPVEIIPLKMFKTWRVLDMTKKPAKFLREEPMTAENEKDPWEFSEGGQERRRDYSIHFFVLVKKEVDEDEAFPCLVSFRRTSVKAGKHLATQLFKMAALGKPNWFRTAMLSVGKDKFETNTYALYQIERGNPTDEKGVAAAKQWYPSLDSLRSKVNFEQEKDDVDKVAPAPVVVGSTGTVEESPY